MKIFDKLKVAVNPKSKLVFADFKRLNEIKNGLGDAAISYVLSGENETVLSTLTNSCNGKELEVCSTYHRPNSVVPRRRELFVQDSPYDTQLVHRYVEVLAASCPNLPQHALGTEKANKLARLFFTEVIVDLDMQDSKLPGSTKSERKFNLTLDVALQMLTGFGSNMVDLIDILYNEPSTYSYFNGARYRSRVDMKSVLINHPDEVMDAAQRIHANSRSILIRELHSFGLAQTPDYFDFTLQLASDSAKRVRDTATAILSEFDAILLEPKAIELLSSGKVNTRAGMVEILSRIGSESALAALSERKQVEKTARIVSAIESALTVSNLANEDNADLDGSTHYLGLDGSQVAIPAVKLWPSEEHRKFGDADKQLIVALIREENQRRKLSNIEAKKMFGRKYQEKMLDESLAKEVLGVLNSTGRKIDVAFSTKQFINWNLNEYWAKNPISDLPVQQTVSIALRLQPSMESVFSAYQGGPFSDVLWDFLHTPEGDVRLLESMMIEQKLQSRIGGYGADQSFRDLEPGDLLRHIMRDGYHFGEVDFNEFPAHALWPYVAQNLKVIDEAFGLVPQKEYKLSRSAAVQILSKFPKPPAKYLRQLLEAASGETKTGRDEARAALADLPEIQNHLAKLLDDSRQAIRAGVAQWVSERGETELIPALKRRLKKEKSEIAKAAILTALDSLGEDLSGYIGPKALLEEAEAGLKKAKFDKLDWLALDHLPKLRYRNNQALPSDVLKWWLFLATKLKQPGGNALFDLYLERLKPDDVAQFSTWVLDSWCNYDTVRPSEDEGNAYASQHAQQRFQQYKKWVENYTVEQAHKDLKREFMSAYLNSGAATKGILALAKHTPPAISADRVRNFLKNHGSRTSQASSLLELLASKGDPVSLQVVISAATRLKQKGVQKFATTLIEKVAEANAWSLDELADRTVPSVGLDDDGILHLPCGEGAKLYQARIGSSMNLELRNPDGKIIKSLPGGADDNSKASKKLLSASRKELKQVVAMQTQRLYEALCGARRWQLDDWTRDIAEHPVMHKLAQRLVWLGLDDEGNVVDSFRPTAEGDFTDAADEDVDISSFANLGLAHGAMMSAEQAHAWEAHLKDYEVEPLLVQFGRSLLSISDEQKKQTLLDDRKGWVTDTFGIRGVASKLGYERGEAMDAGFFSEYLKRFQSAGIVAVIEFTGNCLPEENVPACPISLSFRRDVTGRSANVPIKLSEVPAVLLSECWNDYRAMAGKGAFDSEWEKKMPWR